MSKTLYLKSLLSGQKILLLVLLMSISQWSQAQVYRCQQASGTIVFSDEPCAEGEVGKKLNWLKTQPSSEKKAAKPRVEQTRAQATAKKARRENESYVLLSLLTTTILELETASLKSQLDDDKTELPELLLPDGITVDLLMVDKIEMSPSPRKNHLKVHFVMADGYEEVKTIKKPFPVISGSAKIGRFSKSLEDIKRIEFFNSKKLRQQRGDKIESDDRTKSIAKQTEPLKPKTEAPVIELDLSDAAMKKSTALNPDKKTIVPTTLMEKKVVSSKDPAAESKNKASQWVSVILTNDTSTTLLKASLGSTKGDKQADKHHFILNDQEHIAYDNIRSIRIRPNADNSKLVVAVALKTGETKMENMLPPFTRIQAMSHSGEFDQSLLEIKSISFQR